MRGDLGVSEWRFTGTRADGTRIEVDGVDIFTFRDGRIPVKNAYRKQRPRQPTPLTAPLSRGKGRPHDSVAGSRPVPNAGQAPRRQARAAYDPRYDPLVAHAGHGQDYAPTYWVATAGTPPADDGPITRDIDADVVVIGSGFTGFALRSTSRRTTASRRRCSRPTRRPGAAPAATAGRGRTPAGG